MRSRPVSRLLGALATSGAVVWCSAVACEPQDIYLFDESSVGLEGDDAGADEPEPTPPPSEPDAAAPPPEREQPECLSSACAECVERDDCGVQTTLLFCHPVTGACELPCDPRGPAEQPAFCTATDQCDRVIGLCVECVEDANCTDGPRAVCNLERGQCAECVGSGDCSADAPICDPDSRCVECVDDNDCAVGLLCQPGAQRCVQCIVNSDCRLSDDDIFCLPEQQRCVECLEDADCTEDPRKPFCSSENECEDERE